MSFDYHATKRAVLDGASGIGRVLTPATAERFMTATQIKRRRGRNMVTDEVWQYRSLAGGALVVEIAYGWFVDKPLFGLSVFCVADLARDAGSWDHSLSACFHDVESLLGRLATLEAGGRERLEALAAAA